MSLKPGSCALSLSSAEFSAPRQALILSVCFGAFDVFLSVEFGSQEVEFQAAEHPLDFMLSRA